MLSDRATQARHFSLDWLRIFGTASIFLFHAAAPYTLGDWHFNDVLKDPLLTGWSAVLLIWSMPLLFVISGASTQLALQTSSSQNFVRRRMKRLAVPLLFGIFVIVPPQVYIERISRGQFSGDFLSFVTHYFNGWYLGIGGGGNFAWMGLHLWYLLFLLVLTLVFIPFVDSTFVRSHASALDHALAWFQQPCRVLLLALPIALLQLTLGSVGLGGWNIATYPLFFVFGYVLYREANIASWLKQEAPYAIPVAVLSTTVFVMLRYANGAVAYGQYQSMWVTLAHAIAGWSSVVALLSLAYRFANSGSRTLAMLSDAALPFYVLHQTAIVIASWIVCSCDFSAVGKYASTITLSFAVIVLTYWVIASRSSAIRFLFGMPAHGPWQKS